MISSVMKCDKILFDIYKIAKIMPHFDTDNLDSLDGSEGAESVDEFLDPSCDDGGSERFDEARIINLSHTVTDEMLGERLDKVASMVFTGFSRSSLQAWIGLGELKVNGTPQKSKYRVRLGDVLTLITTIESHSDDQPENIPIDVVYADDQVLVINKPAGRCRPVCR